MKLLFEPRWFSVWQRNFLVLRKIFIAFLIGNFGDPFIYLLALGYGLGRFVGAMDGMPYLMFLASGIVCSSAMNAATFEGLYSAYTRMSLQQTWDAMLSTPLSVADVVKGEIVWAATKGLISAFCILIVAALMGLVVGWRALWILPVIFLLSNCFAAMALVMTGLAKSYDFFTYYFTLFITPIMFLSGVFFPLAGMPVIIQKIATLLPLYHGVEIVRPLMTGRAIVPELVLVHIAVLLLYTIAAYWLAVVLVRRRLIY